MEPRNQPVRKTKDQRRADPDRAPNRSNPVRQPGALLPVRSALVLTVAVLIGLGGAGLLYVAHRPVALIVLGGLGFFGGALKLLDSMIE